MLVRFGIRFGWRGWPPQEDGVGRDVRDRTGIDDRGTGGCGGQGGRRTWEPVTTRKPECQHDQTEPRFHVCKSRTTRLIAGYRRAGSFSRHFRMTCSMGWGMSGTNVRGGRRWLSKSTYFCSISSCVLPAIGFLPVIISYAVIPNEKMSARSSTG